MTNQEDLSGTTALRKLIVDLAQECFDAEGTGLLLSRLGQMISKMHPELRPAFGSRKLAEFIQTELASELHLLTSPQNSIVKVVLPVSVQMDSDIEKFFPKRETKGYLEGAPRYNRAFWAAFSQPLAEGHTRLVGFEPQVHFEDFEGELPAETVKKVISRNFITNEATVPDPIRRARLIADNIHRWLQTNDVNTAVVLANADRERFSAKSTITHKGTPLEILLTSLNETDLKRIQMPLDIVAKLLRHP